MKNNTEISEDLSRRIDMLASRSNLTRGQEKWIAGVQAGIEAADREDFASEEEIAAVLNKFSQA